MRFRSPPRKLELGATPPIQRRCSPMTSFWQYKVCADIFGGFPEEGRQSSVGLSKTVILVLCSLFLEALVVRPTLLYGKPIIQSVAAFTLTSKYLTLTDRKGNFTLNSLLFCQVQHLRKAPLYLI